VHEPARLISAAFAESASLPRRISSTGRLSADAGILAPADRRGSRLIASAEEPDNRFAASL